MLRRMDLMGLLIAILLSVTLQPPFIEAEAEMLGAPSATTIDVNVRVEGTPTAVLARITGLAGEQPPVALVPRGGDTYGQVIRLTAWEDVQISFEYIGVDGETAISDASTLSALGVDVPGATPTTTAVPPPEESGISPWAIAGIAAALGAFVVLIFWSYGGLSDSLRSRDAEWTYAATAGLPDEPVAEEASEEQTQGS